MQRIWSPLAKPKAYEPLRGVELQYGNNNSTDSIMDDASSFTTSMMSEDDEVDIIEVDEARPGLSRGTVSRFCTMNWSDLVCRKW
jgi:hypothetical protein